MKLVVLVVLAVTAYAAGFAIVWAWGPSMAPLANTLQMWGLSIFALVVGILIGLMSTDAEEAELEDLRRKRDEENRRETAKALVPFRGEVR
ncbi:MAG: hypothetical protein AB7E55_36695 [Pigmentiphaga sp.]